MAELDLSQALNKICRELESILQNQAPKRTGALKDSIQVVPDGNDGITIQIGAKYGIYLYRGTGSERDPMSDEDDSVAYDNLYTKKWDPKPGKGKGGMKPRYWMNFSTTVWEQAQDELERAIQEALQEEIENRSQ